MVQPDSLSISHRVSLLRGSLKRYTQFLTVGVLNALVDLAVLNLLFLVAPSKSQWVLVGCNTVAVICAIANSYYWNRRWTFSDQSDGSKREIILFICQGVLNLIVNDAILEWVSAYFRFSKSVPVFVSSNAAKGIAMFLSSSASYLFLWLVVFRTRRRHKPTS